MKALDTAVAAVTVDAPDQLAKTKRKLDVDFAFLSDQQGALMDQFDLRHKDGHPEGDIPRSASILLDRGGNILWATVAENYRVRPTPQTVLAEVKRALGK